MKKALAALVFVFATSAHPAETDIPWEQTWNCWQSGKHVLSLDKRNGVGQIRFVMFDHRIGTWFGSHGFRIQWTWYEEMEGYRAGKPVPLYDITMQPNGQAVHRRNERFLEGQAWKFGESEVLETYQCRVHRPSSID